jgi:hypothetical protein
VLVSLTGCGRAAEKTEKASPSPTNVTQRETPAAGTAAPGTGNVAAVPDLQARTGAPSTGAAAVPGLQVVDLVVRADPFQVTTTCPATITFSGRISVTGTPGTVAYQWVRSDGAKGLV